jgi:hypothetical protein
MSKHEKADPQTSGRSCVFCGAPETSNEHVFPQWLLDVIPGTGPITHTWDAPEGSDSKSHTWTSEVLTFKAKVVCQRRCNGGWMSRLERCVRPFLEPMIRGNRSTIYPDGSKVIAHWGLKTAMMIDFAQERQHRCVPGSDYPALYEAKAVLPDTFVWIGACDFGAGALARPRTLDLNHGDGQTTGFGVTLGVGHLVIEIIRVAVNDGHTLRIRGRLATALRRLWPYTNVIVWPPAAVLSRQQASRLGQLIEKSPIDLS